KRTREDVSILTIMQGEGPPSTVAICTCYFYWGEGDELELPGFCGTRSRGILLLTGRSSDARTATLVSPKGRGRLAVQARFLRHSQRGAPPGKKRCGEGSTAGNG